MGDRGNIVVRQGETNRDDVWFYGHWDGHRLMQTVETAIGKRWRWDDPSYLARIVFDEFCPKRGEETGFGISTSLQDNEYPIVVVDIPGQCIWTVPESDLQDGRIPDGYKPKTSTPFAACVKADA